MPDTQATIAEYRLHDSDTASPEVQIALLSGRINHLTEHLKAVSYTHLDVYKRQHLDHGPEDHHRLLHPHEQGARGH